MASPKTPKDDRPVKKFDENFGRWVLGYNLALKFTIMLACPILTGFGCGLWLDKQLGTTPWIMFALVVAGFIFSIYAVYRVAKREQN